MNDARRRKVRSVLAALDDLGCAILTIQEALSEIITEEQNALDNMPEYLQDSEKGHQMQDYIDSMECAMLDLEYIDLDSIRDQLQEVIG